MVFIRKDLSAEALDHAVARYRAGDRRREIAAELGVSVDTFAARMRERNVPLRYPARATRLKAGARRRAASGSGEGGWGSHRPDTPARPGRMDIARQASELELLSARNMAALRRNLAKGGDPDRAARTIAMQTRTLENLRRLRASLDQDISADDESPPRSLAELRDDLHAHLVRIADERRSEAVGRDPEGEGSDIASAPLADLLPARSASARD